MSADWLRELRAAATPGPWAVDDRGSSIEIGDSVTLVAEIDTSYDGPFDRLQCEADARLIAIAPDLAELCAEMAEVLEQLAEECFERMAAADLEAWDAPYRIEYPGKEVDAAREALARLTALQAAHMGEDSEATERSK